MYTVITIETGFLHQQQLKKKKKLVGGLALANHPLHVRIRIWDVRTMQKGEKKKDEENAHKM